MQNKHNHYIAIIDYGISNLFSVAQACKEVGMQAVITSDKEVLKNASAAILPGIGAFAHAIEELTKRELVHEIRYFIEQGKPFMGICLGMQLLMDVSEEFGICQGLGVIRGEVKKFYPKKEANGNIKVPLIGWNRIHFMHQQCSTEPILEGICDGEFMYFVHSYYVHLKEQEVGLLHSNYGDITYCCGIRKRNVFAFQFHPEKSGNAGLRLYENFKKIILKGGIRD